MAGLPLCAVVVMLVKVSDSGFAQPNSMWFLKSAVGSYGTAINYSPLDHNTIYASVQDSGLIVSTDGGETWKRRSYYAGAKTITIHPIDGSVFLGFYGYPNDPVLKSNDGGRTFRQVLTSVNFDGEGIVVDPVHPDTMYIGGLSKGFYMSTDRGETWVNVNAAVGNFCSIAIRPDSTNIIYGGTGAGGIFKSTDLGLSWRLVQSVAGSEVPRIIFSRNSPLIGFASVWGDSIGSLLKTTDGGETWHTVDLPGSNPWAIDLNQQNPDTIYVGSFSVPKKTYRTIHRSSDGGTTWTVLSGGLPRSLDCWMLRVLPGDGDAVLFVGTFGVYKNGSGESAYLDVDSVTIPSLALGDSTDGTLRITDDGNLNLAIDSVTSTNKRLSFISVPSSISPGGADSIHYRFKLPRDSPIDTDTATVTVWSNSVGTFQPVVSFVINPHGTIYVPSNYSFYNVRTDSTLQLTVSIYNGGDYPLKLDSMTARSLILQHSLLFPVDISSRSIVFDTLRLSIAEGSSGTLRDTISYWSNDYNHNPAKTPVTISIVTAIGDEAEKPVTFRLEQNFPNPFNSSTTISYRLPKPSIVRLSIYNIFGQELQRIVNERKEVGVYSVSFHSDDLPSGVYYYRLQTGDLSGDRKYNFLEAKKMLILR